MAENATDLYYEMMTAVLMGKRTRMTSDSASPTKRVTVEAEPGRTFALDNPAHNMVRARSVDVRWAVANVLHFFACTEEAACLRRYCKHADRFLTGDSWVGAYGPKAAPGIDRCVDLLRRSPDTRRAVVCLSDAGNDINSPPCWNTLHFLRDGGRLDLLVYQRSLHAHNVMPYDCVLLTNVLMYAAFFTGAEVGKLRWTVGSLHCYAEDGRRGALYNDAKICLPPEVLSSPAECFRALQEPSRWDCSPYSDWLRSDEEVRT